MGHDLFTIGHHNLDVSSLEALAQEISIRFNANVEYGIYDTFCFDWDGFPREPSYEHWIFGKIESPNAETTLLLTDEFFNFHINYYRYGENAVHLPYFQKYKSNRDELINSIGHVCYELRNYRIDDDYGIIFDDSFYSLYNNFDWRWWSFCRAFTKEDHDEYFLDYVTKFRIEALSFLQKIGIFEVFYVDDQGSTQYLTTNYSDWETIVREVDSHFKETTLNISQFMKHKNRLPRDQFPLAFYDDFADLKMGIPSPEND